MQLEGYVSLYPYHIPLPTPYPPPVLWICVALVMKNDKTVQLVTHLSS